MTILDKIIAHKRQEVAGQKELYPVKLLERSIYFQARPVSLKKYILRPDLHGIIAEFKRKSPSKGMINEFANPGQICLGYMQAGASALSVLTDTTYFGGSKNDLIMARKNNYCPILRKDFIVDEYQVIESRSIGADAILLIVDVLTDNEIKTLFGLARSLDMEVLFEVHDTHGVDRLPPDARIVGVNSRNLKNFSVDTGHAISLVRQLPEKVVKVAESGIDSPEIYATLREAGYCGFLIGEYFMREASPQKACEQFISGLKKHVPCI
jgi:indole-3-glycerol phosphate synthase